MGSLLRACSESRASQSFAREIWIDLACLQSQIYPGWVIRRLCVRIEAETVELKTKRQSDIDDSLNENAPGRANRLRRKVQGILCRPTWISHPEVARVLEPRRAHRTICGRDPTSVGLCKSACSPAERRAKFRAGGGGLSIAWLNFRSAR